MHYFFNKETPVFCIVFVMSYITFTICGERLNFFGEPLLIFGEPLVSFQHFIHKDVLDF